MGLIIYTIPIEVHPVISSSTYTCACQAAALPLSYMPGDLFFGFWLGLAYMIYGPTPTAARSSLHSSYRSLADDGPPTRTTTQKRFRPPFSAYNHPLRTSRHPEFGPKSTCIPWHMTPQSHSTTLPPHIISTCEIITRAHHPYRSPRTLSLSSHRLPTFPRLSLSPIPLQPHTPTAAAPARSPHDRTAYSSLCPSNKPWPSRAPCPQSPLLFSAAAAAVVPWYPPIPISSW
jgi:hypothetical protein